MPKNLKSATLVAAGLLLWLASGLIFKSSSPQEPVALALQQPAPATPGKGELRRVRVEVIWSEPRIRSLVLRGRTESKREVDVKAEIAGTVVSRPVERGMHVAAGATLCEIAVDDREVAVDEAAAALENARIEHQGSLRLKQQGLLSESAIASSAARLAAAKAQLHRQEINLERTRITAPFGGIVEDLHMSAGDYATPGASCATLLDLNPMLVHADINEKEVDKLQAGDGVFARTSTGRELRGVVTFIGKRSDPVTRTYPVEITVDNSDYSIRSGLTVSAKIGLDEVQAHQVSPALFTLGDSGEIGIRAVDESNRVVFHEVRIIEDGPEGVWVTGLPGTTRIITVGQEYVSANQLVEPVYPLSDGAQLAQP